MSSDYSQQEPKVMTQMCGDENMIESYRQGKDLYAEVASNSFNVPYEFCLEFFPKGTPIKKQNDEWVPCEAGDIPDKLADGETDTYKDGKKRRSQAKSILLGILYGRGDASIAEQLGCTIDDAKRIKDSVFTAFPAIKELEESSFEMAKTKGYVTTLWGRKRRLPALQLPDYTFLYQDNSEVPEVVYLPYLKQLQKERNFEVKKLLIDKIKKDEGIKVINNWSKISEATRQVINSRIQGSAADMTKKALITVHSNDMLKKLEGTLLIPVHDELIMQAPLRYKKESEKLFAEQMSIAATDKLTIPISCDVVSTFKWYGEPVEDLEFDL